MRISDWSSDVCSSDLKGREGGADREGVGDPPRPPPPGPGGKAHPGPALPYRRAVRGADGRRRGDVVGRPLPAQPRSRDRKSVVEGKRVSVPVDLDGRRLLITKKSRIQ